MTTTVRHDILLIFLIGLVGPIWSACHPFTSADTVGYELFAHNLMEHKIYGWSQEEPVAPSAYRTPVYPTFLALIKTTFGNDDMYVLLAQAVVASCTCLVMYGIALLLFRRRTIARVVGLACAAHPFLWYRVGTVMTEVLFTFLIATTLCCLVYAMQKRSGWLSFIGGALFVVTCLCRPVPQFFAWAILLAYLVAQRSWHKMMAPAAMFVLGLILAATPWTVRNWYVTGQFTPLAEVGPTAMIYLAQLDENVFHPVYQPDQNVAARRDEPLQLYLKGFHTQDDALLREAEERMRPIIIDTVRKKPVGFLLERLRLHPYMWIGSAYLVKDSWHDQDNTSTWVMMLKGFTLLFLHILPLGLYVLFAWRYRRTWRLWLLPFLWPMYVSLAFLPLHIEMRFSMPAYPFILLFAVATCFPFAPSDSQLSSE